MGIQRKESVQKYLLLNYFKSCQIRNKLVSQNRESVK